MLAIASVGAVSTDAYAQTPNTIANEEPSKVEIIVTAQRREERLQDVPIAISVLNSEKMELLGLESTKQIFQVTPGMTLVNSNGFLNPRIRGVGSTSAGPGVENSVAVYVDGVYLASSPATALSLINVERVEVLKGPQGTLFGRNATGGLIHVITKDPQDSFAGEARFGYGNYETSKGSLYVTGPIATGISADISASVDTAGNGFGTNYATGGDSYKVTRDLAVRSKWLLNIGDSTDVRLMLNYSSLRTASPSFAPVSGTRTSSFPSIFLPKSPWDVSTDIEPFHNVNSGGAALKLNHDLGFATLTSLSAYNTVHYETLFDGDIGPTPSTSVYYKIDHDQFTQELQLTSNGHGKFEWIVGAYYFDMNAAYAPYILKIGGFPGGAPFSLERTNLPTATARSIAGYAQATYQFLPDTSFTAGVRYTDEVRKLDGTITNRTAVSTNVTPFSDKTTKNVPTWRLVLAHQFNSDVMGYASYNRGFKSGGYTPGSPTLKAYLPEYLDAFEFGLKTTLLDGKLTLNSAGYLYKYKNIQVNTYLSGVAAIIYNGAEAEIYGTDINFDFAATRNFKIFGGLSLIHDRFTSFPAAVIGRFNTNGTTSANPGSATGNKLPSTPDMTFSLGASIDVPTSFGKITFAANNTYNDGYFTEPDNLLRQDSYNYLNGSLTFYSIDDRFSLKFWGTNLFNKAVVGSFNVSGGGAIVGYQDPRRFGVIAGVKF